MWQRICVIGAVLAACAPQAPREGDGANPVDADVVHGGDPSGTVEVIGTVRWHPVGTGFWGIDTVGGDVYDPLSPLEQQWQRPGLPVRALVRPRSDLVALHFASRVEVLRLDQISCEAFPCPGAAAAVRLAIWGIQGETSSPLPDGTLANIQAPSSTSASFFCETAPVSPTGPATRTCSILADAAGVYEADVIAPGFQSQHVRIEVPARPVASYECCAVHYVPVAERIDLAPVN